MHFGANFGAFEKPKEIKEFGFSDNEKIKTYLSYFAGIDDIFAYEYYSFNDLCLDNQDALLFFETY